MVDGIGDLRRHELQKFKVRRVGLSTLDAADVERADAGVADQAGAN